MIHDDDREDDGNNHNNNNNNKAFIETCPQWRPIETRRDIITERNINTLRVVTAKSVPCKHDFIQLIYITETMFTLTAHLNTTI